MMMRLWALGYEFDDSNCLYRIALLYVHVIICTFGLFLAYWCNYFMLCVYFVTLQMFWCGSDILQSAWICAVVSESGSDCRPVHSRHWHPGGERRHQLWLSEAGGDVSAPDRALGPLRPPRGRRQPHHVWRQVHGRALADVYHVCIGVDSWGLMRTIAQQTVKLAGTVQYLFDGESI